MRYTGLRFRLFLFIQLPHCTGFEQAGQENKKERDRYPPAAGSCPVERPCKEKTGEEIVLNKV